MDRIQLKANGLLCTFFVFAILSGMILQTNSSVILSTLTSGIPSTSGNSSSLSATSIFNGNLYINGPTFSRPYGSSGSNYYYQPIRVTVYTSGTYLLTSSSLMGTYGCLYDTTFFYPSSPYTNLLVCDDDSGSSEQFSINFHLQNTRIYILVVTTPSPYVSGSYSITATGLDSVSMAEMIIISTTKSGSLSSNNPTFARSDRYSTNYYYESIQLTTSTTGLYTFKSRSSSSTDLYGCLYLGWFDPSNSSTNQLICDDDSGDNRQFEFLQDLSSSFTYTLVITTALPSTTGSYSVSVTGPSLVSMTIITPNTYKFPIAAVVGIAVGCFAICVALILSICVRQRRRQTIITQNVIPSQYKSYGQYGQYPASYGSTGQEAPPSYDSYVSNLKT